MILSVQKVSCMISMMCLESWVGQVALVAKFLRCLQNANGDTATKDGTFESRYLNEQEVKV